MGIRIHKAMGYGLDDLKRMGARVHDPRLAAHPYELLNGAGLPPRADFVAWLEARAAEPEPDREADFDAWWNWHEYEDTLRLLREDPQWAPKDSLVWEGEMGLKRVLVLIPPQHRKAWCRWDDTLDHYESLERFGDRAGCPRVRRLPGSIYPISGDWRDGRTGKTLEYFTPAYVTSRKPRIDLDVYAARFGFASGDELRAWARPPVPHAIQHLCAWLGLFTDPATVHALRPMIYTYWS